MHLVATATNVLGILAGYIARLKFRLRGSAVSARNMADALDHVAAAIYMKDCHRRYIYANRTTLGQLQTDVGALYVSRDEDILAPADAERIRLTDERVLDNGVDVRDELIVGTEASTQNAFLQLKHPLRDKSGRVIGLVGISTDVTELYRLRRELEHLARIDELTGVYNRRALFDLAEQDLVNARRHGRPLSMLIIDIDHFKRINDSYGHPVGDRVLKDVATRVQTAVREVDRVGRIGGEEFVVILPEADLGWAVEIAERVRTAVQPLALQNGVRIEPTVSIGTASLFPEDCAVQDLYQRADEALYRAKHLGRNQVVAQAVRGES